MTRWCWWWLENEQLSVCSFSHLGREAYHPQTPKVSQRDVEVLIFKDQCVTFQHLHSHYDWFHSAKQSDDVAFLDLPKGTLPKQFPQLYTVKRISQPLPVIGRKIHQFPSWETTIKWMQNMVSHEGICIVNQWNRKNRKIEKNVSTINSDADT